MAISSTFSQMGVFLLTRLPSRTAFTVLHTTTEAKGDKECKNLTCSRWTGWEDKGKQGNAVVIFRSLRLVYRMADRKLNHTTHHCVFTPRSYLDFNGTYYTRSLLFCLLSFKSSEPFKLFAASETTFRHLETLRLIHHITSKVIIYKFFKSSILVYQEFLLHR
jgi:hypothetical protein